MRLQLSVSTQLHRRTLGCFKGQRLEIVKDWAEWQTRMQSTNEQAADQIGMGQLNFILQM